MTPHDLLNTLDPVGLLALTGTVMMFVGVVLATIWSRHAYRRPAARTTMNTLLEALRRLHPL
ncbi:hypothetical protein AB0L42_09935 [Streptomyces sp. NPDC052287]|uniref:hypothetical protein n=1 Tax=Streptomyces sp. NPDC052287 TaxID=3154950 RepID=UPI00343B24C8